MNKKLFLFLFIFLLVACSRGEARSRYEDKIVYFGRVFAEDTYSYTEYPLSDTDIVLVADKLSVLWVNKTDIYFWPLTNDWKTDIKSKKIPVEGTLQILQKGRIIQTVDLSTYVVQIEQNMPPHLFIGQDATQAYQDFELAFEEYRNRLGEYQEAYSQYQVLISTAFEQAQKTGIPIDPKTLPTEPSKPEAFKRFSSEPALAYPINLASGEYDIRVVDPSGRVLPDSTRRIIAISPIQTNITYKIIPQNQWTKPEMSNRQSDSIFSKPAEIIYLAPEITHEYRLEDWQRVKNPQKVFLFGDARVWIATVEDIPATELVTSDYRRVERTPYRVIQNPGNALGYTIVPKPSEDEQSPDFSAFEITAPLDGVIYRIALEGDDGIIPGSEREISTLRSPSLQPLTWMIAFSPLLVSLLFLILRKKRARKPATQIGT